MRRRCILVLPLLSALAYAWIPDLTIDHSTLPNGLELLLHTDRKAPIVHINIRLRVGSKHDRPGQFGIAHLTEHVFSFGQDGALTSTDLVRLGATNTCGDLNEDFTEFCESVPASVLERTLWLESNRFARFLGENLTQKNLDREREAVVNERRQKLENVSSRRIHTVLHERGFPQGHPYGHEPVGEYADLRSITLDDVRSFYAAHYTPDQTSIAIVGDFDPAQAKQWVARYFGPLIPADLTASPIRSAPPRAAPGFVQLGERIPEERVHFAWVGPPAASGDSAALDFAAFMLSDDYSPRNLHKALTDRLSQGISIGHDRFEDASLFYPYVTVTPGASVAAIEEKIVAELARLGKDGPTAAEMTRARNHLESNRFSDLESISGMAFTILQVDQFYGGIEHWGGWAERYTTVTADDVRAAVTRWLVMPSHLTIDLRPLTSVHSDTAEPDRVTPPPLQPEKPFRLPEIQTTRLENGLTLFVLERHELPKVSVRLQFRAGAIMSPSDKPGVMIMAAAAAGKDNKTADGVQMEQALADLGGSFYGDADSSSLDFGISVLRKNLDAAFRIAFDAFLHPVYPEWAIDARRKDWIQEMEKPDASIENFYKEVAAAAFGPDHPLGRGLGTPESLRRITAADVRAFHDRYWKPDVAALIFAGDITLKEAVTLATDTLSGWTGKAPAVAPMPPDAPKHDHIIFLDRKGATQTMVVEVLPGIPRDHPDYPALFLADRIYGGMESNRIWSNIRGQHSIAYYARSELAMLPGTGLWLVMSPVQQDSTALAMREFDRELTAFGSAKPITQTELDQARTGAIRSLPEQFETLDSAAGAIGQNWAQGLSVSDLQIFNDRLNALTVEKVNAAARKYARSDRAFFLLVGDREKIEPQLSELK